MALCKFDYYCYYYYNIIILPELILHLVGQQEGHPVVKGPATVSKNRWLNWTECCVFVFAKSLQQKDLLN